MWQLQKIEDTRWDDLWQKVDGTNLLQSRQYGLAKQARFLRNYNYLIVDEQNEVQGLIQFLAREIPFIGGVARVNRGPLFINTGKDIPLSIKVDKSLEAINNTARKNSWWYIRFAPELQFDYPWESVLLEHGLTQITNINPYGSLTLSLDKSEDELFSNLKGKWRNLLRKSMTFNMDIRRLSNIDDLKLLLERYEEYQKEKYFSGISVNLLRALASQRWKGLGFYHSRCFC